MTRASTTLFWFSLTILVSLGLYHTSYRVENLGHQLRSLNADIEAEQRNIHVLKAEWVFLANPARIETAARKHLDLKPTTPQQVTRLGKISALLPTVNESVANAAAAAHPVASLTPHAAAPRPKAVAEESGRLNTRLVIQKTASAETLPPTASLRMAEDNSFALANSGTDQ